MATKIYFNMLLTICVLIESDMTNVSVLNPFNCSFSNLNGSKDKSFTQKPAHTQVKADVLPRNQQLPVDISF